MLCLTIFAFFVLSSSCLSVAFTSAPVLSPDFPVAGFSAPSSLSLVPLIRFQHRTFVFFLFHPGSYYPQFCYRGRRCSYSLGLTVWGLLPFPPPPSWLCTVVRAVSIAAFVPHVLFLFGSRRSPARSLRPFLTFSPCFRLVSGLLSPSVIPSLLSIRQCGSGLHHLLQLVFLVVACSPCLFFILLVGLRSFSPSMPSRPLPVSSYATPSNSISFSIAQYFLGSR